MSLLIFKITELMVMGMAMESIFLAICLFVSVFSLIKVSVVFFEKSLKTIRNNKEIASLSVRPIIAKTATVEIAYPLLRAIIAKVNPNISLPSDSMI